MQKTKELNQLNQNTETTIIFFYSDISELIFQLWIYAAWTRTRAMDMTQLTRTIMGRSWENKTITLICFCLCVLTLASNNINKYLCVCFWPIKHNLVHYIIKIVAVKCIIRDDSWCKNLMTNSNSKSNYTFLRCQDMHCLHIA